MIVGEDEHARCEANPAGHARGVGQAEERRHPRDTVMSRHHKMLADPERVEPELLGAPGERADPGDMVKGGVRPGVGWEVDTELQFGSPGSTGASGSWLVVPPGRPLCFTT